LGDKDPVEEFVWRLPAAIGRFADGELKRLAAQVRHRLCAEVSLPHVDSLGGDSLWHQYCDEIQKGPSPMAPFWELHIDPFIDNQMSELSQESALLVSSAIQWERNEVSGDGQIGTSDELLRSGVRAELHRLALDESSEEMLNEFEPVEPVSPIVSLPPSKLRSYEVARQNGRESRSILIEFPTAGTIRLSGQDMGPSVQAATGDDDYEFWVDVESSALPHLATELLLEKYGGNLQAVSEFRAFCEGKQIPHEYMTF
jgi:hypothetical protein